MKRRSAAIALVFAFATLAGGQPADADRSLRTAHGLLNRGLFEEAATEYRSALEGLENGLLAAEASYGLGVALSRSEHEAEAIDHLADAARHEELRFRPDAIALRASLLRGLKRYDEAAEAAGEFISLGVEHASTPAMIEVVVESLYRTGEHRTALRRFERYKDRLAGHAGHRDRATLFAAAAAGKLDRGESAIELLGGLATSAADKSIREQATMRLGLELLKAGRLGDARIALEDARAAAGPATLNRVELALGSVLRLIGDADGAVEVLGGLRERAPDYEAASAAFELGVALLEAGSTREARRAFSDGLEATAEDARGPSTYWLAKAELADGQTEPAVIRLQELLDDRPEGVPDAAGYDLAVGLDRLGRQEEAIDAYGAFSDDSPDHNLAPDALYARAALSLELGRDARASRLALQFLREFPDHDLGASAGFIVGEAAYRKGDDDEAIDAFSAVLEATSDLTLAERSVYRLGMSLARAGRSAQVRPYLVVAVTAAEDGRDEFVPAIKVLADAEFDDGNWAEASGLFDRFLGAAQGQPDAVLADAVMRRGLAAARLERFEDATGWFRRVLDDHADSVHAEHAGFELGQTLVQLGQDQEAEPLLRRASETSDSRFAAHALRHLASIASRRGDAESAANLLEQAASSGLSEDIDLDRARALIAAGRAGEAASVLQGVSGPLADAWRVVALSLTGDSSEAMRQFDRLDVQLLVDGGIVPLVRYHAARAARALGETERAAELFGRVVREDTGSDVAAHAAVEHGLLLADAKRFAESEATLASALDRDDLPEELCAAATYRYAWLLSKRGAHRRVSELLDSKAVRCRLGEFESHSDVLRGIAQVELGRPRRAAERFAAAAAAFEGRPELAGVLIRLGEAYAGAQQWEESREAFSKHARAFPDDTMWFKARFGIGWAMENRGDPEGAIEHYKIVVAGHEGATAARAQFQIGECLFAIGRHEEAVRELLRVDILYAEPEWSAAALYEAGRCFEALGKVGEARAQYRELADRFVESEWAAAAAERLEALTPAEGHRRGQSGPAGGNE